ncbi:hypothetical protein [Labedella phragmitis]|uniref:hypothetical protein n=1 Tax=Labedella phragmitis TaxID=2498849 RepID=UPI00140D13BE|nr:hypothetical protein [Labedella phragmitis]
MVGFDSRPYTNTTGTQDWFVVAPHKAARTIYDDYAPAGPLFDELGSRYSTRW